MGRNKPTEACASTLNIILLLLQCGSDESSHESSDTLPCSKQGGGSMGYVLRPVCIAVGVLLLLGG